MFNPRFEAAVGVVVIGLLASLTSAHAVQCQGYGGFGPWLEAFKKEAVSTGISRRVAAGALKGITYNKRVIALDRDQRAFKMSFEQFAKRRISAGRLSKGRQMLAHHAALLKRIERLYGVPGPVLVASKHQKVGPHGPWIYPHSSPRPCRTYRPFRRPQPSETAGRTFHPGSSALVQANRWIATLWTRPSNGRSRLLVSHSTSLLTVSVTHSPHSSYSRGKARPTSSGSWGTPRSSSPWTPMGAGYRWGIRRQSTASTTRMVAKW